jgi:hypothetical protein
MISLCCCDQAVAGTKIRFGFARHRRWGFIPRLALFDPGLTDLFDHVNAFLPAGFYDVYRRLDCLYTYRFGYLPEIYDRTFNYTGTCARKGGGFSTNLGAGGEGFDTNGRFVGMATPPQMVFLTSNEQITVSPTQMVLRLFGTWKRVAAPEVYLYEHTFTRTLGDLVTPEQIEEDMLELLEKVDLRSIRESPFTGVGERLVGWDQNGDVVEWNTFGTSVFEGSLLPVSLIARQNSGIFFPDFGFTGARVALWAGWSPNPSDTDPAEPLGWPPRFPASTLQNAWPNRTGQIGGNYGQDGYRSDRFEVYAGKCLVTSPSRPFYARQTESKLRARMGADSCVNLRPEIGTRTQFLLGATAADRARHPGVLSLRPWEDHEEGQFIQVSDTPC